MDRGGQQPDLSVGIRALAVLVPLFAVALVVYSVRIWTRIRPKNRLNAADHAITVAFIAEAISMVMTAVAVSRGFGRPAYLLSSNDIEVIGISTFIVFVIGFWASTFARISVACLLLQITQERIWRGVLWSTVVFNMGMLVATNIVELFQCRPIRAIWAPVPDAKCFSPETIWSFAYSFIGLAMVSDAIFAIFPTVLIWRLSRSSLEKALLSVLMGLGLFAMVAGVFKILTMELYDITSDNLVGDMMPAYLWNRIEEILLIIAACAPLMKVPLEGVLSRRCGLPRFNARERRLNSVHTMAIPPNRTKGIRYYEWWYGRSQVEPLKGRSGSEATTSSSSTSPSAV